MRQRYMARQEDVYPMGLDPEGDEALRRDVLIIITNQDLLNRAMFMIPHQKRIEEILCQKKSKEQ